MTFKFKLQPLLKHRTLLEDQARQALAEAMSEESALQQHMDRHNSGYLAMQEQFEEKKRNGMALQELLIYERSLKRQAQELKELRTKAADLQARTERQRNRLTEASKDKTLMEKLKSKKEEEHRQDMLRQEMNHLDEMALLLGKLRP